MTDEDGAAVVQELSQRACPWTDPDECAAARERAVAGISEEIPTCAVHGDHAQGSDHDALCGLGCDCETAVR